MEIIEKECIIPYLKPYNCIRCLRRYYSYMTYSNENDMRCPYNDCFVIEKKNKEMIEKKLQDKNNRFFVIKNGN